MSGPASWMPSHGKLWYDDPWYRAAWFVLPQALVAVLVCWIWLFQPGPSGNAPWAKPVQNPVPNNQKSDPAPPLAESQNALASCKSGSSYEIRIQSCTAALRSAPLTGREIAEGHYLRADAYSSLGRQQEALDDYNQAVSIAPAVPLYLNDRGILLRNMKDYDRAMLDFDKAVSVDSNYALGYANKGRILYLKKRYLEGLDQVNIAIAKNDKLVWAYFTRAGIYEALSNWRLLFDDATKLIQLTPNDASGYQFRGRSYHESGQYAAAISDFTKSISLAPKSGYSFEMRGRSYFLMGQYDKAREDYAAALLIDPNDTYATNWMNELKEKIKK